MTKASTIVAIEGFLLVALLPTLRLRLAPRWVDPREWDFGQLFLLLMVVLLSTASDSHLPRMDWNKRSLSLSLASLFWT